MVDQAATKETGRLETFADGVFAIAITLLVLEIRIRVRARTWARRCSTSGHRSPPT